MQITKENFGGLAIADLLIMVGFAKTKSEARRLILQNGIRLNDQLVTDPTMRVAWNKLEDGTFEVWTLEEKQNG